MADKKLDNEKKAEKKQPARKADPNAVPPNKNTLMAAAALIVVGGLWFMYELNPGGMLRGETDKERKERIDLEKAKAYDESMKKHKASKGGHGGHGH